MKTASSSISQLLSGYLKMLHLLFLLILVESAICRVGPTTFYDGVTPTMYNNSYIRLNGNQGVKYVENAVLQPMSSYSLSIWFRQQQTTNELQKIVKILTVKPNGFDCLISLQGTLRCQSDNGGGIADLIITSSSIRLNNWYILMIRSQVGLSQLQLRETSFDLIVDQTSKGSFFPGINQISLAFSQLTLGIDSDLWSNGFVGNIRNLKVMSGFLNDTTMKYIQYSYLFPYLDLLRMQIMLSDANDINNIAGSGTSTIIQPPLIDDRNYTGVLQCWSPTKNNIQGQQYNITSFQQMNLGQINTNAQLSSTYFQAWVYRQFATDQSSDQVLFSHNELYTLQFLQSNAANINVQCTNRGDIITVFPYSKWIFVQVNNLANSIQLSIYENNGVRYSYSESFGILTTKSTYQQFSIGTNFIGYILGIKFFKDSVPINGPHPFQYLPEANNALMYFMFTDKKYSIGNRGFNGIQQNGIQMIYIDSGYAQFTQNLFIRQYQGPNDQTGMIQTTQIFDGVTCLDNQDKLFFPSSTSYATLPLSVSNSQSSYTLEFWFKSTQPFYGEAFLLSQIGDLKQLYLTVKVETDRSLSCYTSQSSNPRNLVKYLDFTTQNLAWIHLSCLQDSSQSQQKGTLFIQNTNYAYFLDQNQSLPLPQMNFLMYLNSNPLTLQKGASGIYYSEIRLWKYARGIDVIQNMRFQQIDVKILRVDMLTYLKMSSGTIDGNNMPREYDYCDVQMQKSIQSFNGIVWQSMNDIVICPVGFYKSQQIVGGIVENQCYREGVIRFQLLIYRQSNNGYIITPNFSKFRNNLVMQNGTSIYNYQWNLDSITAPPSNQRDFSQAFKTQIFSQQQFYLFNQVSDNQGVYGISLTMTDLLNQQDPYSGQVVLRALYCANIFDQNTLSSMLYIDLNSAKGSQDVVFTYGFSDCPDYKLDQGQMSFSIDNDGVSLSSGDHNATQQTFTLRKQVQTNLPLNEYFYLKIKGVWKSTKNPSDTAEFYMIYGCRYVQKLVLSLIPNQLTLLKGQQLILNFAVSYTNMNMVGRDKSYTILWTCPGNLNTYCNSVTSSTLSISYDQVANAGLQFWKSQTITLTAQTNYIQGDGLKTSNASIDITWLDVNSDARIDIIGSSYFSINQNVTLQLIIPGLTENLIQIKWAVSPKTINNTGINCFPNQFSKKQFLIDPRCLQAGVNYNASASILYNVQGQVIWSGSILINIPKPPANGTLICTPTTALRALIDSISCTAPGWAVKSGPLRYQFFLNTTNNGLIAISPIQTFGNFSSILPPTSNLLLKVLDQSDQYTFSSISILVISQNTSSLQDIIQRRLDLLQAYLLPQNSTMYAQQLVLVLAALGNVTSNQTFTQSLSQRISDQFFQVSLNYTMQLPPNDQRKFFTQSIIQMINIIQSALISNTQKQDDIIIGIYENFQNIIQSCIMNDTVALDTVYNDINLTKVFFQMQSMIVSGLGFQQFNQQTQRRRLQIQNNTQNTTTLNSIDQVRLGTLNNQARQILVKFEQFLSIKLGESQNFFVQTSTFNFSVMKYSRMDGQQAAVRFRQIAKNMSSMAFDFPLQVGSQPTERQSLSIISFQQNPFRINQYLNQTAASVNAFYFAYRDQYGNYLGTDSVPGRINMTFPYPYSPFIFLPNVSICAYIGVNGTQWDNTTCITTFNRENSITTCSCQHMSFYSIIDDYLEKPVFIPLIILFFKNWVSIVTLVYVIMFFIIGVIYSYNKDNQDFRYLHEQEELNGNEMEYDEQVSLVSLAFKRKVFFMNFSESYSLAQLFRLYLMLIHPLFQLKYRLDPHLPRFYRFLLLFTRLNLSFALTFFILRDHDNTHYPSLVAYIILGSFFVIQLPLFLYSPLKSSYYLLKPKQNNDSENNQQKKPEDGEYIDEFEDRITDVMIDATIPIKLIFLINAMPIEKIIKDESIGYCTGDPEAVGKKLLELEDEVVVASSTSSQTLNNLNQQTVIQSQENIPEIIIEPVQKKETQKEKSPEEKFQTAKKSSQTPQGHRPNLDEEDDENMEEGGDERLNTKSINDQQKNPRSQKKLQYEGGEPEPSTNQPQQQEHQATEESDFSIDTNLFIDEKKEILEFQNVFARMVGGFLALAFNLSLIIAVIYLYLSQEYYNRENYYVWVVSFYGSQLFGFFITSPVLLLIQAFIVSKWCRLRKSFLARFFTESLYIYEDYQFVVKFAKTKIS